MAISKAVNLQRLRDIINSGRAQYRLATRYPLQHAEFAGINAPANGAQGRNADTGPFLA